MKMKLAGTLMLVFSWLVLFISQVSATNVGYRCRNDQECREGNGGVYSKCYRNVTVNPSSRCLCTYTHLGERVDHNGTDCVFSCSQKGECNISCAETVLRRFDTSKDWYGTTSTPLVSLFVPDTNTSVCYEPDRANNSRPRGIVIKKSEILKAGLGAFTEDYIPRGTVFGPYTGIKVDDGSSNIDYSWVITDTGYSVDAKHKHLSNWLRYIDCPNTTETQNVSPVQYQGEIYYYTYKSIPPGSELLVYYGDGYAKRLGIKNYDRPKYTFGKDGNAGGRCVENTYGVSDKCNSVNAVCIDEICMCKAGTYFRAGSCLIDEMYGGECDGRNGEDCQLDKNAECVDGICNCKYGTSAVWGVGDFCTTDEMLGGICDGENGEHCKIDQNAICFAGQCTYCSQYTKIINGTCVIDISDNQTSN